MKTITKLFFSLFLLIGVNSFAQQNTSTSVESAITSLEVKVTEIEELETLDWDDMFQVFDGNAAHQPIEIALVIDGDFKKKSLGDAKVTFSNFNIRLNGIQENRTQLRESMKEGTAKIRTYLKEFTAK
ncbi:hypothetical protein [Spongiimicrobium salis]|uniref:hypothetical protein n=1 Tax=Spongiimicrobium salis TaxID=1667022 RepID=UPI00374DDAAC